ncbi:Bug family tripartite tricarboxylate transporter substrate binding protein [Prauserella alba]|uniref:Tripartite tricarboxylate transporter substrate binding protein n=1 Tax=Prauserella alba TaxID=176898 RepID=A0ABP4FUR7_9PSEU|nr:substrate-binding domain-containing protein [Prauserella alba]MCP2181125.1 Tripartite-type tricarboxylate transporter, receptor component TctC [Prauserella alba]
MHPLSRRNFLIGGALGVAAGLAGCAPPQAAFNPSGPGIVDVIVPYAAGGGTDTWGRFVSPYFAELQNDVSRYQIENIAGGGSVTGTNAYVAAGVNNGRHILVSSGTTYLQSMLGQGNVEFDFREMVPLVLHGTGGILYSNAASGIRSMEDLLEAGSNAKIGGISASGLDLVPLLALDVLGASVTGVFGFGGRGPSRLALERGETDIDFQTTSTWLGPLSSMAEAEEIYPLFSVGVLEGGEVVRDPNMPDVPTLEEIYRDIHGEDPRGLAYEAYQSFVTPAFFYQKGFWSNAGTSDELVDAYAELVGKLNKDEKFLKEAAGALGGYELQPGRGNVEVFRKALNIRPQALSYAKGFLTNEYGAVLS